MMPTKNYQKALLV